jgi:hypothetical protein
MSTTRQNKTSQNYAVAAGYPDINYIQSIDDITITAGTDTLLDKWVLSGTDDSFTQAAGRFVCKQAGLYWIDINVGFKNTTGAPVDTRVCVWIPEGIRNISLTQETLGNNENVNISVQLTKNFSIGDYFEGKVISTVGALEVGGPTSVDNLSHVIIQRIH